MVIKESMRVRELHMREYYDEEIDEYNTAFSLHSHLLLTTKECVILWGNCSAMAFIP